MKKFITVLLLVLPLVAFSQDTKEYIEVRGQSVVKVVPDLIYLRIQISEKQKYRVDLDLKEKQMLGLLGNIGIDSKDITVQDLASNFRQAVFSDNIVLSKEYIVLVRDAKTANKIVSALETLEISNIKIERLDHTRMGEFKKESTVKAIVAAKEKAEALTHAIGEKIGRALYIEEVPNAPAPQRARENYAYKAEMSTSSDWFVTDLEFDEIKMECTVLVRFELKSASSN